MVVPLWAPHLGLELLDHPQKSMQTILGVALQTRVSKGILVTPIELCNMGILAAKLDVNRDGDIDRNGSSDFHMGHEENDEDQILAALIAKKRSKKLKKDVKLRNRKHTKFKSCAVKHRGELVASNEQEDHHGVEDEPQNIVFNEARRTWDLGKSIGLVTEDDNMVMRLWQMD